MKISEHYSDYPEKTLIVVTNNEVAKILSVFERNVDEITTLKIKKISEENPSDEVRASARKDLYRRLSKWLVKLLKTDYKKIILCSPEANREEVIEAMHKKVMDEVHAIVPKNLASLPMDQIVRILQETRSE